MVARIRRYRKHWLVLPLCALTPLFGVRLASQQRQPSQAQPPADPHAAIRANNLGAAYLNQQRMEQALAQFKQAQAVDPKLAAARVNEAIALLNLQRIEPARALLGEIVARDPQNIRAWYNLGLLDKNAGDAEKALAAFEKAAALDAEDADTHYFIGTLLAQLGRYSAAIAAFERAIKLNPFHVSAEFGLARAQQRSGNPEQARLHLARFQHLNTNKLGAPMSLAYGDQGQYSLAETVILPPGTAQHVTVRFTLADSSAPLVLKESGVATSGTSLPDKIGTAERFDIIPWPAAACALDFDSDGWTDLVLMRPGMPEHIALLKNSGGRYAHARIDGLALATEGISCAAGDLDSDGYPDIVLGSHSGLTFLRNDAARRFVDVTQKVGHLPKGAFLALTVADYDHDGDLDVLAFSGRQSLIRNNGDGTFTDQTEKTGWQSLEDQPYGAIPSDLNNDRAIDFFAPRMATTPAVMRNMREGPFIPEVVLLKDFRWTALAAIADFDRDGWMDIAATIQASVRYLHSSRGPQAKAQPLIILRNQRNGTFEELNLGIQAAGAPAGLAVLDFDNDGWQDIALLYQSASSEGRLLLLRNQGQNKFKDVTAPAGIEDSTYRNPKAVLALDFDNDGDSDLAVIDGLGSVFLLRNESRANNWLKLSLKGLADNKSAIGTKVEVFAGATYQKFEITTPNDLLIGLGQEKQADVVRLLWPTGVLQDEVNLAANQRHEIMQIDRRGSSCPVLFAWNGSRYEFIADAIGPGIVGHWVAPGMRNTSDPTEYIKIPGSLLRERRGPRGERLLSFRFAEPMEEIVYLDQLRLFAIDHPSDTDVNPSERFYASGPPFPTGDPVFTQRSNARPPASARDHRGRDVTALLRARDRRYVSDFADAPYKGFAELHWIEFDLGGAASTMSFRGSAQSVEPRNLLVSEASAKSRSLAPLGMTDKDNARPLRLLLHGYTDYFTATSVYAAHQGGVTAIVPYVEALTPAGDWVRIADDMGFPAGLARTMVADLTGKLPPGTRRIRISTNLKIYWDQILIDTTPGGTPHRISEAPLASARAGYLGYPREIRGTPASDIRYDYHTVSATGPYARAAGHYTRYGDVLALVAGADDRFVLMGSGDEVAVDFDAAALPPVPEGWTRDWFFYVDGFAKDMDFYAAHPFTVTPLPYHAMPGYPYSSEHNYPDRGAHLEDQLELNTRAVSGRPAPSYRYAYPK